MVVKSDLVRVVETMEQERDFYRNETERLKKKVKKLLRMMRELKVKLRQ